MDSSSNDTMYSLHLIQVMIVEDGELKAALGEKSESRVFKQNREKSRLTDVIASQIKGELDAKVRALFELLKEPISESQIVKFKMQFLEVNIEMLEKCMKHIPINQSAFFQ